MTNRNQFNHPRVSFEALPVAGLMAAGLRLRLTRELSAGFTDTHHAFGGATADELRFLVPVPVSF